MVMIAAEKAVNVLDSNILFADKDDAIAKMDFSRMRIFVKPKLGNMLRTLVIVEEAEYSNPIQDVVAVM